MNISIFAEIINKIISIYHIHQQTNMATKNKF
jgi:hypothetical protein